MLDTGLKVLIVASEVAPFAKTGGLADVAGSLPKALLLQGNDVRVVLPRYRSVQTARTLGDFPVQVGNRKATCVVRYSEIEAKSEQGKAYVPVYLLDNYHYFDRDGFYMYPDEGERFSFFDLAVVRLCEFLSFLPDVVHCNDWQTGFIPLLIKVRSRKEPAWSGVASCYTIHNLQYQGRFPPSVLDLLGLDRSFFTPQGVEFYGDVSFMKAGIVYADVVSTVSETYAKEIQTPEFGEGMDGILRERRQDLFGIVNGINYHEFNPKSDPRIFATYDSGNLCAKKENKHALQRELGLPVSEEPLLGMVSRLVDQKGLDILLQAMPNLLDRNVQFVMLGTGDPRYEESFLRLMAERKDKMAAVIGFNGVLAQKIYAGSDMFLMPSKFEPCGLGQLIAMRYGSVPVARRTGGLVDTVLDYDPATSSGTGFLFDEYSPVALLSAVDRALQVYRSREEWQALVRQAMERDYSWNKSAALYTELYIEAMGRRGRAERTA